MIETTRNIGTLATCGPLPAVLVAAAVSFGIFAAPSQAAAQPDVTVDASVDSSTVAPHDTLTYRLSVRVTGNYELDVEQTPEFGSFAVHGRSYAPSFRIHNGNPMRSLQVEYKLRAPRDTGTFTIGPPRVSVGDDTITPDPVTVEVTGDDRAIEPAEEEVDRTGERAFVEASLRPNRDPYVGEQVILQFDLYINQRERNLRARPPGEAPLDDFWVEDLSRELQLRRTRTRVDGDFWSVTPLRVLALFPIRSGPTTVDAIDVPLVRASLFGQGGEMVVESDPIELEVQPLPDGAPRGFSPENIGSWDLDVDIDSTTARVGGRLQVTARVEGTGRPGRLGTPVFDIPDTFRHLSTQDDASSTIRDRRVGGHRDFIFHLMPLEEGSHQLPPVEFSYFDPDREEYITLRSDPIDVEIEPGELPDAPEEAGEAVARGESSSQKSPLTDLHGLVEPGQLSTSNSQPIPWWLFVLPLVGLLLLLVERPLTRPIRRRLAPLLRRRRLRSRIDEQLDDSDAPIATRCLRALRICLIDGLRISVGALTAESVETALRPVEIPNQLQADAMELVDELVTHRYAPTSSASTSGFEKRTRDIVDRLLDWHLDSGNDDSASKRRHRHQAAAIIFGVFIVTAGPVPAHGADQSDDALQKDSKNWTELAEKWAERAAAEPGDPAAHYNAGTAAAHADDLGAARLHLERAVAMGADNDSVRENLSAVTAAVAAQQPSVAAFRQQQSPVVTLHGWAPGLVLMSLWIAFLFALFRRLAGRPRSRPAAATVVGAALAIALSMSTLWVYVEHFARTAELAVVTADEQPLRQAPSHHAGSLSDDDLAPGAIVRTDQTREDWTHVQLPTGLTGWLPADTVEHVAPP